MAQCKKNVFVCLLVLIFLLSSCENNNNNEKTNNDALNQELSYGIFETAALSIMPWDSGRCETTTNYAMAETQDGYYLVHDNYLWYADKDDLSCWVPVCNQPDCKHQKATECSANIHGKSFVIKNGRIFYLQSTLHSSLFHQKGAGILLASMNLDGSDQRVEYILEEAISSLEGGSKSLLTPDYWICCTNNIDANGNTIIRVFCVTDDRKIEYPLVQKSDNTNSEITWIKNLLMAYGDPYFFCVPLGTDPSFVSGNAFLISEGNLIQQDLSMIVRDEEYTGMHISGNTLRLFRRNDGYYDRNLSDGTEVKLSTAELKNSNSFIVLPNCIIETTLHSATMAFRKNTMQHKMSLYDGETWHKVALPENLRKAPISGYLKVFAVTSDSIFMQYCDGNTFSTDIELYRIALGEKPELAYCCTITAKDSPQY